MLYLPQDTPIVFFLSIGSAVSVILYFLVVWIRAIFFSTQTAVIFDYQDTYQEVCGYLLYFCSWQKCQLEQDVQYISTVKPFKIKLILVYSSLCSNFLDLIRVEQLSASTMMPEIWLVTMA